MSLQIPSTTTPNFLQGYAYILTHPGIPCIYWEHYFDWNHGDPIKRLVKARKYAV